MPFYATSKLKQLRKSAGYDQKGMVEALSLLLGRDVSLSWYQKIEQKKGPINVKDAVTISKELGASANELFKGNQ